jgi:hypothetical protein
VSSDASKTVRSSEFKLYVMVFGSGRLKLGLETAWVAFRSSEFNL